MPVLIDKAIVISIAILIMRATILACKFGLVIFIGRYLDLASLGLYGLAAGAVGLGPAVIGMGMVHLIMRDAVTLSFDQLTLDLRHYWSFTTAIYGLLLIGGVSITILFGVSELWSLVILIMLFEHFGSDVFLLFSNLERPLLANVSAFLRGAAWILIYVPIAIWDPAFRSTTILFEFWLGGTVSAFFLFIWGTRSWPWTAAFKLPFKVTWIATTIRKAFVIYVSDISFVGSQYLDRYLVSLFLGLELAGVYFLYWSVASAVSTFVSIVVFQNQRPRLIKAYHNGGALAHRQLSVGFMKTAVATTAAFSIAVGCAFYVILPFLKQPTSIADHVAAFWLIMAGLAVRNIADFGAMVLFTAHRDHMMTLTNLASIIALTLAQLLLLPLAGLYGAGPAILFTFSAITFWRCWLSFRRSAADIQSSQPL
jgi:O-antigen/teichoic acid export membrane protein